MVKKICPELRLDLGCGKSKKDGFIGVDIRKNVNPDKVLNLGKDKWPWKPQSVKESQAIHLVQYLSSEERIHFFNELHRVMIDGAKSTMVVPHWNSLRSHQDPFCKFPLVCETSFLYLNKEWREMNDCDHYGVIANFDFSYGYNLPTGSLWLSKSEEPRNHAIIHYANVVNDIHIVLIAKHKKRKTNV